MLAGLIQRPNYDSPYRHPDRAIRRRNLVLDTMVNTGAITPAEAIEAKAEPLDSVATQWQPTLASFESNHLGQ